MSKSLKKISVSVLLFLIAAPAVFFICFTARQQWIKYDMKQQLEISSLHTITIPINSINWKENNKEILLDGKLFDIASYTISDGQITIHGLFDEEEDNFNRDIKSTLLQKGKSNTQLQNLAIKFLLLPLFNEQFIFCIQNHLLFAPDYFATHTVRLLQMPFSITAPPPKV